MKVNIQKIKQLAKEKGISISFICDRIGMGRGYLNDIQKSNGGNIPDERLAVIVDILNTTTDYLCDKTDAKERCETHSPFGVYDDGKSYFWINISRLCLNRQILPSVVFKKLGIAQSDYDKWREGALPNKSELKQLSDYFGVSEKDLILNPEETSQGISIFSKEAIQLIEAYNRHPEVQEAVKKLLGINSSVVYRAARSSDGATGGFESASNELVEKLKTAPSTDEDL